MTVGRRGASVALAAGVAALIAAAVVACRSQPESQSPRAAEPEAPKDPLALIVARGLTASEQRALNIVFDRLYLRKLDVLAHAVSP